MSTQGCFADNEFINQIVLFCQYGCYFLFAIHSFFI